jgi:medium-chain acyl-[acyl-carrier-protein] hydrolase
MPDRRSVQAGSVAGTVPVHSATPVTAALDLVAFPCAGGTPALFAGWAERLPDGLNLRPVRLPGRLDRLREPPFTSMQPLAEALASELAPAVRAPFALFGHSMGALVAFELARELRRRGNDLLVALFVASCYAPHLPRGGPMLRDLPDDRFVAELRRLGAVAESAGSEELLELTLPALRADIELCETYSCAREAPLDVPISAFVGDSDPRVGHDDLAAWTEQTHADFEMRVLPGDHFFSWDHQDEIVDAIATDLRTWMGFGSGHAFAETHPSDDEGREQ